MSIRRLASGLAILAILGTLALLLFPLAYGPYCTTHGPVAFFRGLRGSLLQISIVLFALSLCWIIRLCRLLPGLLQSAGYEILSTATPALRDSSVLRC